MGDSSTSPKDRVILVVDDDPVVLNLIETYVQLEGFQCVTAVDGRDAINKLKSAQQSPDLVITDLMMPNEGGYELLRNLQAEGHSRLPVFVITASKLDQTTIQMIRTEANVVEFVPKPIPRANFVTALHRQLKTVPQAPQSDGGLNDRRYKL